MNDLLHKNLISTKEASSLSGYNSDYLSRLCREGKIRGTQVGRTWLVERESIEAFMAAQVERKLELAESLARERGLEYQKANAPIVKAGRMTDRMERSTREAVNSVMSAFSRVRLPKEAPMLYGRAFAMMLTAVVLGASVTLAGTGAIARAGQMLLDTAFAARSLALDSFDRAGEYASKKQAALADAAVKETRPFENAIARSASSRIEAMPNMLSEQLSSAHAPVEMSALAYARAEAALHTQHDALSFEEVRLSVLNAITHPADVSRAIAHSSIHAYTGIGQNMYQVSQNVFALHARAIDESANALLVTGAIVRDTPSRALEAQIAFGTIFVALSDATFAFHEAAIYAFVEHSEDAPRAIVGTLYATGDSLASALASSVVATPRVYDQAVIAFAQNSADAAESLSEGSFAFGRGATVTVASALAAEDAAIRDGVHATRLGLAALGNGVSQTVAFIRTLPSKATNETLGVVGNLALAIETADQNILPANALAALDLDQFIPGFLHDLTAVIARAVGSMAHGVFGPLAGFFGASGEVGLAVLPNDETTTQEGTDSGSDTIYNGPVTLIRNEYPSVHYGGVSQTYVDDELNFLRRTLYNRIEDIAHRDGEGLNNISGESGSGLTLASSTINDSTWNGGTINNAALNVSTTTITGSLTVNGDLSVNGSVAGNSTTTNLYATNATTSNFYSSSATVVDGFFTNLTTTLATITNAVIANLTATNATLTNATTTNATTTDSFALTYTTPSRLLQVDTNGRVISSNLTSWLSGTTDQITVTDNGIGGATLSLPSLITIGTSQPTTIGSNGATSTFGGAIRATTIEASNYIAGPYVLATSTTATSVFSGNIAVGRNVTLGTSASDTLTVNSYIGSSLIPTTNNTYDLGSAGNYWRRGYVDTLSVNTLSAATTSISNTVSDTFVINADNATNDTEDASLAFERGTATPNALITWNASTDRFEFNMPVFSANGIFTNLDATNFTLGGSTFTSLLGHALSNVGGVLSVSTSTLAGQFFQQNGNSFGTTTVLGTNDSQDLTFETNNTRRLTINATTGNVGIGITNPAKLLTLYNADATIRFSRSGSYEWDAGIGNTTNGIPLSYFGFRDVSNGSTPLVIAPITGNVGIGTTSPVALLSLGNGNGAAGTTAALGINFGDPTANLYRSAAGTIKTDGALVTGSTLTVANYGIFGSSNYFGQASSVLSGIGAATDTAIRSATGNIYFAANTATVPQMILTSTGNVGIGTTTPVSLLQVGATVGAPTASANRLTVSGPSSGVSSSAGNVQVMTTDSSGIDLGGSIVLGGQYNGTSNSRSFAMLAGRKENATAGNFAGYLQFSTQPDGASLAERMRITSTGNVGIGTTSPSAKLAIDGGSNTQVLLDANGTGGGYMLNSFGVPVGSLSAPTGLFTLSALSSKDFTIQTSATERFRITSAGNVGVGTSTPAQKFVVAGNAYITGALYDSTYSAGAAGSFLSSTGIGTAWTATSTLAGSFFQQGGNSFGVRGTLGLNDNNALDIVTNGLVRMTIGSTGRVGIGTTTPGAKLDITAEASGKGLIVRADATSPGNLLEFQSSTGIVAGTFSLLNTSGGAFIVNNSAGSPNAGIDGANGRIYVGATNGLTSGAPGASSAATMSIVANSNRAGLIVRGASGQAAVLTEWQNTSGTALSVVDASGNFGIGTTSPNALLHVGAGGGGTVTIPNGGGSNISPQILAALSSGTAAIGVSVTDGTNNRRAGLFVNQTDGLFGLSSTYSTGGANFVVNIAGIERFRITDSTGNVGIGTTTPGAKLQVVAGGGFTPSAQTVASFQRNSGTASDAVVSIIAGNAALSSLYFGDTDSESMGRIQYNHATNALSFGANGVSNQVTLSSAGYLGIGTTTPTDALHVVGSIRGSSYYGAATSPVTFFTDQDFTIDLDDDSNNISAFNIRNGANTSIFYIPETGSSYLNNSGGLGIGTTTPDTSSLLHLVQSGNPRLRIQSTGGANRTTLSLMNTIQEWQLETLPTTGDFLINSTGAGGDNEFYIQRATGNVGIGTTSPETKLQVYDATTGTSFSVRNAIGNGNGATIAVGGSRGTAATPADVVNGDSIATYSTQAFSGGSWFSTASMGSIVDGTFTSGQRPPSALMFSTNAANQALVERLRITSSGNVGIGSTSPAYKLTVSGGQSTAAIESTTANQTSDLRFISNITGNDSKLGTIGFYNTSSLSTNLAEIAAYQGASTAHSYLTFTTRGSGTNAERMRIDSTGNVGIGTTTPVAKLDINGATGDTNGIHISRSGWSSQFRIGGQGTAGSDFWLTNNYKPSTGVVDAAGDSGADYIRMLGGGVTFGTAALGAGVPVERLRIDSTGNVGIGTSSPNNKLHVVGTSDVLRLSNTSASGFVSQEFEAGTTVQGRIYGLGSSYSTSGRFVASSLLVEATGAGGLGLSAGSAAPIRFYTGTTEKMTILSGGNVGIGTSTPATKLSVAPGTTYAAPTLGTATGAFSILGDDGLFGLYAGVSNTGNTWLQAMRNNGSGTAYALLLNPSGGNVGIGTTTPAYPLEIVSAGNARLNLKGNAAAGVEAYYQAAGSTIASLGTVNDYSLAFVTNSIERLRITNAGNVGIGITAPTQKLTVEGSRGVPATTGTTQNGLFRISPSATDGGSTALDMGIFTSGTSAAWLQVSDKTALGTEYNLALNPNGGNVGIGTSNPTSLLYLSSDTPILTLSNASTTSFHGIEFRGGSSLDASIKQQPNTGEFRFDVGRNASWGGKMTFYTDTVERMRITDTGNVGIGTASPSETLHLKANETGAGTSLFRLDNSGTAGNEVGMEFWTAPTDTTTASRTGRIYSVFDGASYTTARTTFQSMTTGNVLVDLLSLKNGMVGIGTTTPATTLHVVNAGATQARFAFDANNYTDVNYNGFNTVGGAMTFKITGTERARVDSSGYFGIGTTSPATQLHVDSGGVALPLITISASGAAVQNFGRASASFLTAAATDLGIKFSNKLYIGNSSTATLVLDSSGNAGVGTSTPPQKLTVAGNAYITGALYDSTYSAGASGTILTSTVTGTAWVATSTLATSLNAFVQNGNSFGTRALLGTNDNNALDIETNGAVRMTISASGNVGIGTTTPQTALHLVGNTARIQATIDGSNGVLQFYNTAAQLNGDLFASGNGMYLYAEASKSLILGSGGASRLTIDSSGNFNANSGQFYIQQSSGNVGIGTASPNAKLDVKDTTSVTTLTGTGKGIITVQGSGTTGEYAKLTFSDPSLQTLGAIGVKKTAAGSYLSFGTSNSYAAGVTNEALVIDYSGNVGIGTTTPTDRLAVQGGDIVLNEDDGGSVAARISAGTQSGQFSLYNSGATPTIYFSGADSNNSYFAATNANLGIGSTTPYAKLSITGAGTGTGTAFQITTSTNIPRHTILDNGNTSIMVGTNGSTTPAFPLVVTSNQHGAFATLLQVGNVIGNTNDKAAIQIQNGGGTGVYLVADRVGAGSSDFTVHTASTFTGAATEKFRITAAGNVGIGTTTPGSLLTVAGNTYTTGTIIANSGLTRILSESGFGTFRTSSSMRLATDANGIDIDAASYGITFDVGGTDRMFINSSGNVGIGTTTPSHALNVFSNSDSKLLIEGTGNDFIKLSRTSNTSWTIGNISGGLAIGTTSMATGQPYFFIAPTTGNIGIGTTSPSNRLTIEQNGGGIYQQRIANYSTASDARAAVEFVNDTGSQIGYVGAHSSQAAGGIGFANTLVIQSVNSAGIAEVASNASGIWRVFTGGTSSGSERMRITATGNVGIGTGTTTPLAKLHVAGFVRVGGDPTSRGDIVIDQANTSDSGVGGLEFKPDAANNGYGNRILSVFDGVSSYGLRFQSRTNSATWTTGMTLTSAGAVGIGTTTPLGADKLNVVGSIRAIGSSAIVGVSDSAITNTFYLANDGTTATLAYNKFGGNIVIAPTSGNVGIGTTSPAWKLTVFDASNAYIHLANNTTGSLSTDGSLVGVSSSGDLQIRNREALNLTFFTNDIERMRIDANGNVGIGTTSPGTKLDINVGDITGVDRNVLTLAATNQGVGDETRLRFYNSSSVGYEQAYIGGAFDTGLTDGYLSFGTRSSSATSEKMRILGNGNVGIGATLPLNKLDVVGTAVNSNTGITVSNFTPYGAGTGSPTARISFAHNSLANPIEAGNMGYVEGGNENELTSTNGFLAFGTRRSNVITEAVRILSSGNVGIGTINPGSKLTINNTDDASVEPLRIFNDNSNLAFAFDVNGAGQGLMAVYADGTVTHSFYSGGNSYINVGNFGVGTTTPAAKLHINEGTGVAGNYGLRVSNTGITSGYGEFTIDTANTVVKLLASGSSYPMAFNVNGSERMRIATDGSVMIGTTSALGTLTLSNTAGTTGSIVVPNTGSFRALDTAGNAVSLVGITSANNIGYSGSTVSGGMQFSVPNAIGGFQFFTGAGITEQMRLTNSGNLGIGTSTPASKLHVEGVSPTLNLIASTGNALFRMGDSPSASNRKEFLILLDNTNNRVDIQAVQQGVSNRPITINAGGGNVAIGSTTAAYTLSVDGTIGINKFVYGAPSSENGFRLKLQDYGGTQNDAGFGIESASGPLWFNNVAGGGYYWADGTNGTRMTLTGAGNLGIGTTSPSYPLEVNTSAAAQGIKITQTDPGTAGAGLMLFHNSASPATDDRVGNITFNGLSTTNTESTFAQMRGYIQDNTQGNISGYLSFLTTGSNSLTEKMRITGAGNVGIGSTTPYAKLSIVDGNTGADTTLALNNRFRFQGDGVMAWGQTANAGILSWDTGVAMIGSRASTDLVLITNGTGIGSEKMRITTTGNVGIGTTSPNQKLEVDTNSVTATTYPLRLSNSYVSATPAIGLQFATLNATNAGSRNWSIVQGFNGVGSLEFLESTSASTLGSASRLFLQSGGNVGIGTTTPGYPLTVNGQALFADFKLRQANALEVLTTTAGSGGATKLYAPENNGTLQFFTSGVAAGNEKMRIDANGNVGIGTSSPADKLHVAADGTWSGSSSANGQIRISGLTDGTKRLLLGVDTTSNFGWIQAANPNGAGYLPLNLNPGGGNVGVGTTSPSSRLDVWGSSTNAVSGLRLVNSNTTAGATVRVDLSVFNGNQGLIIEQSTNAVGPAAWASGTYDAFIRTAQSGSKLHFAAGNSSAPYMTIGATGNVGIGSTTPNAKLSITGSGTSTGVNFQTTNSSNTALVTMLDSGRVGFGTTTPEARLTIVGPGGASTFISVNPGDTGIILSAYNASAANSPEQLRISHNLGNADISNLRGALTLQTVNGGAVGIGTTSPVFASGSGLHIFNSTQANLRLDDDGDYADFANQAGDLYIINRKSTGDIKFRVNNSTEALTIIESGRVGIGTTTPTQKLSIVGNLSIHGTGNGIYFPDGSFIGTAVGSATTTGLTSPTDLSLIADSDTNGSGVVTFSTNGYERMRVANNGNIGIGTSTPSASLDVVGVAGGDNWFMVEDSSARSMLTVDNYGKLSTGRLFAITPNTAYSNVADVRMTINGQSGQTGNMLNITSSGSAAGNLFNVTAAGLVGVGTVTPLATMHVYGDLAITKISTATGSPATTGTQKLILGGNSGNGVGNQIGWYPNNTFSGDIAQITADATAYGVSSAGALIFKTNSGAESTPSERLRITSAGNVGIGTNNPAKVLTLYNADATIRFSRAGSYEWDAGIGNTTNGIPTSYFGIRDGGAATTPFVIAHTTGNVGIGTTSPSSLLHLESTSPFFTLRRSDSLVANSRIQFQGSDGLNDAIISYNNEVGSALTFSTGAAAAAVRMTILDGGNVGIGTTNPTEALDVLGDIRLRRDATGLGPSLILNNGTEVGGNYSQIAFGSTQNSSAYLKGGIAFVGLSSGYGKGDMYFLQDSVDDATNATLSDVVMVIKSGGNVGIGTTTPGSKLYVAGGAYTNSGVSNNSNYALAAASIASDNSVYAYGSLCAQAGTGNCTGSGGVVIGAANTSAGSNITPTGNSFIGGNLGIGTASPDAAGSSALLEISGGTPMLSLEDTGGTQYEIWSDSNLLQFGTGSAAKMVMDSSGNVGIGTTTLAAKLAFATHTTAAGGINFGDATANLYRSGAGVIKTDGAISAAAAGYGFNGNTGASQGMFISGTTLNLVAGSTNGNINFGNAGNSSAYASILGTNGNFGIGTTTPSAKLAITGTAGTGDIFAIASSTDARLLTVTSAGFVGIGTASPAAMLQVGAFNTTGGVSFVTIDAAAASQAGLNIRSAGGNVAQIYRPANTTDLRIYGQTLGSDIMTFKTDTGNVGVGTTSPIGKFAVNTGANRGFVVGQNPSNTAYNTVSLNGNITDAGAVGLFGGSSSDGNLYIQGTDGLIFRTGGNTERARITNTGNLGIGTTTPTAAIGLATHTTAAGGINFGDATSNLYRATTGTIKTDGALVVANSIFLPNNTGISNNNTGNNSFIRMNDAGTLLTRNIADASPAFIVQQLNAGSTGDVLQVKNNASTLLTVQQGGNVGIGTSTPTVSLDVNGSIATGNNAQVQWRGSAGLISSIRSVGTADFTFRVNGTDRMILDSSGNLGIGTTTPSAKLTVSSGSAGAFLIDNPASGIASVEFRTNAGSMFAGATNNGDFGIRTASDITTTNLFTVLRGGNVGIGTTTPSAKLAITGTAGTGDVFAVASSTQARLFTVASSGFTGIGTAAPTQLLDVLGTAASQPRIIVRNDGTYNINLGLDSTNVGYVGSTNATPVAFRTNGISRLYIQDTAAGGNVGIGTTTPAAPLNVTGINAAGDTVMLERAGIRTWGLNLTNGYFNVTDKGAGGTSNTTRLTIDTSGNVGIGTTTPAALLNLDSSTSGAVGGGDQVMLQISRASTGNGIRLKNFDGSTNTFNLERSTNLNSWSPLMAFNSNTGNVGIATTSPDAKLNIYTASTDAAMIKLDAGTRSMVFTANDPTFFGGIMGMTTNQSMGLITNNTQRLTIASGGNVGIGTTTPSQLFTVGSNNQFTVTSAGVTSALSYGINNISASIGNGMFAPAGNTVAFSTNSTERVRIDSNGNVGIGTSTPANKFHVAGTGQFGYSASGLDFSALYLQTGAAGDTQEFTFELGDTGAAGLSAKNLLVRGSSSFSDIAFAPANGLAATPSLVLKASGNIGIGTTSPASRLALTQSANTADGGFTIAETGNTDFRSIYMDTSGVLSFFGGDTAGTLNTATLQANGQFTNASDRNYKENITDIHYGLDAIRLLQPRSFSYKGTNTQGLGFIAQELKEVIPEVVYGTEGKMSVDYASLSALALAGVKELDLRTLSLASTEENAGAKNLEVSADAVIAGKLTVSGTGGIETLALSAGTVSATTFLTDATDTLPTEVLTGGSADLYKMASVALAGVQTLSERTDLLAMRIDEVETRLSALESATTQVSGTVGLTVATVKSALASFGIIIQNGVAQFNTLVFRQLAVAKDDNGDSSAGSMEVLAGNTVLEVENPFVLPTSKIFVTFTSQVTGAWYISDKKEGSFRVTLAEAQTSDVSFDYFILQTEGQLASPSGATPPPAPAPAPQPLPPVFPEGGDTGTSTPEGEESTPASGDTTAPSISLNGSAASEIAQGGSWSDEGATATDETDGDLTASIQVQGSVDTNTPGLYTVSYSVSDTAGNEGHVSRIVTVRAAAPEPAPEPAP